MVLGVNQTLLSPSDVQVDSRQDPTYVAITLRGSKTIPFGVGCTLFIGRTNSSICLVVALLAYLAIRPPAPGPLFTHGYGSHLTRSGLVSAVHAALSEGGVDLSRYTGHSFRIGPATAAAQAGPPDSMIQMLGCWRSSAFQRYIRTPASTLLSISHTLAVCIIIFKNDLTKCQTNTEVGRTWPDIIKHSQNPFK